MFIFIQDITSGFTGFLTSILIFDYRLLPSLDFCRVVKVKGFRQSSSGFLKTACQGCQQGPKAQVAQGPD